MSKTIEIRNDNVLPASPGQVWVAITTTEGTRGWLFPIEIEPWEGGTVSRGPSKVIIWNPPTQFTCRHDVSADFFATLDYRIEATDCGSVLHTIITRVYSDSSAVPEDLDIQVDGAKNHNDFFQHTLGQYLRYFNGRPATFVKADGLTAASTLADAFTRLRQALGLPDTLAEGDTVRLTIPGFGPVQTVVDHLSANFIGLRGEDGLYRFFGRNAWRMPVGLSLHLFVEGLDQAQIEQAWQAWLDGVFS